MHVRLTQIDGKLPNLALMRLGAWHKAQGHEVVYTSRIKPELGEPRYAVVYGSAIFATSSPRLRAFLEQWPGAIVGGTGTDSTVTVEDIAGGEWEACDYSGHPAYSASIGFTARGCRLRCKFCVVPSKEGKPRAVNSVQDIWRDGEYPRHLHLLDNDFFGQPREQWKARTEEMRSGGFRVCLNQGINVRLVDDEVAAELASIDYRDDSFKERRLYTAWDNLKDEAIFFRGVEKLERAGIQPKHIMAYMLVGFDPAETWERLWHRFNRMRAAGILPYPMVYDPARKDLKRFQRWVVTGLYEHVQWEEYDPSAARLDPVKAAEEEAEARRQGALALEVAP